MRIAAAKDINVMQASSKQCYVEAVVHHIFDDCSEYQIQSTIEDIMGGPSLDDFGTEDCTGDDVEKLLSHFGENERDKFESWHQRASARQYAKESLAEHTKEANRTPRIIKALAPPGATLARVASRKLYEGVHREINQNKWISRSWDGPFAVRDETEALRQTVNRLWDQHEEKQLDGVRPTDTDITDAVGRLAAPKAKAVAKAKAKVKAKAKAAGFGRGRGRGRR